MNPAWLSLPAGELVAVAVERRLYAQPGAPGFLVHVRVSNPTDRPVGLDLRDPWSTVYPNQWGALTTPQRQVVDEERLTARPLDCAALQRDHAAGALTVVPPGGSIDYFRAFNGDGQAAFAATPYLFVSLAGRTAATDGQRCDDLLLSWPPLTDAATDLVLTAPLDRGTPPSGARVVAP